MFLKVRPNHSELVFKGFQGSLNWVPIIPRIRYVSYHSDVAFEEFQGSLNLVHLMPRMRYEN